LAIVAVYVCGGLGNYDQIFVEYNENVKWSEAVRTKCLATTPKPLRISSMWIGIPVSTMQMSGESIYFFYFWALKRP